ncbi:MAG: SGNH/GDSL hydrolase family protein [Eubacterium sp.]|nr:SGNH/GDSL hydrolase family protein [Eubacterium sp.]MCM1304841.1 SGNH/GDSL hydrolase family protein [Butyrivibrio sp.]MCM1344864.1 SGNH/GDSL hydrolase family protein [Muribaculaceae bacterium]MCM1411771.1 SGNH/GDSL hydrolase family protein [Lachnospiraceae bacterium]
MADKNNKNKKKRNWKKTVIIVAAVIAVVTPTQLVVLGVFGGIGPMGHLRDARLAKLPGNGAAYDFSAIERMEGSPLEGKTLCILGSSVAKGTASQQSAVGEYLAARFGATLVKEAVGGTTLTDKGDNSYIKRLVGRLDANAEYDLFLCQLSTNDATRERPLGEISEGKELSDFDTSTITGAMEYIICYAQQTWDCPVVFFTGSRYDSAEYGAMVERLLELQEKWGIGVLDLWTDDGFNDITKDERSLYMNDGIHPTKAGYRDWWGPEMERQLLEYLRQ